MIDRNGEQMNRGTILYIGGFEMPDKNPAAHRVVANGKLFRDLGYNVVYIDVQKDLDNKIDITDTKRQEFEFDTYSGSYPKSKKDWLYYLSDITKFKAIFNSYKDIEMVICYNYQSIALNRIRKFCRKQEVKVIADCTEWYSSKGAGFAFYILKGLDTFLRMRVIHKKLDGMIAISSYLEKYYKPHLKTIKIPPLVDINDEKWINNYVRNDDKIKFIYAGAPSKNKEHLDKAVNAIEILQSDKEIEFNIYGITKEEYVNKFDKNYIKRQSNRIIFHGRVSNRECMEALKCSDYMFAIRPKNRVVDAGFPTKIVEGITVGTKVLCNDYSNVKEFITNRENGFIININQINMELQEIVQYDDRVNIESFRFHYEEYIILFQNYIMEI